MDGYRVRRNESNSLSALPEFVTRPAAARADYIYPPEIPQKSNRGDAASERMNESVCAVEVQGRIVGVVGLRRDGRYSAAVVRFQFNPAWQRTKAFRRLLRCVHEHCVDHHYLTISMDSRLAPGWVRRYMNRHGFRLIGRRSVSGREQLEYGVDHYQEPAGLAS